MWYQWTSLAAFDAWHADACAALGIPHPGNNAATGELDTDAQWTTAYTTPVTTDAGVLAIVEPDVAALMPDGLGVPSDPPPTPDNPFAVTDAEVP
jgi:hypothetical protein